MIREIKIKNFKSLKALDLSLSQLNVLAGLNGSGKSSFIQSLLLLRQSFANRTRNVGLKRYPFIDQNDENIENRFIQNYYFLSENDIKAL